MVFGEEAELMIQLDQYMVLSDLMHAVEKLKYMNGDPDIANALDFVNKEVFDFQGKWKQTDWT